MNIHEYQAKEIFKKHGIPVPPGEVATTPDAAEKIAAKYGGVVVVKAQVHVGGRGKAGGVKLADTPAEARAAADAYKFNLHQPTFSFYKDDGTFISTLNGQGWSNIPYDAWYHHFDEHAPPPDAG